MNRLIISPQAGMCNRFRALCSAVLYGQLTGRRVYHNWVPQKVCSNQAQHIRGVSLVSVDYFFETNIPFISVDEETPIDEVFSEWQMGDYWYDEQSSAITRCNRHDSVLVERTNADRILNCNSPTILIETSLSLRPSFLSQKEYKQQLHEIYQTTFRPREKYIRKAEMFKSNYVGVHIRRSDHLKYFPDSNVSLKSWVEYIVRMTSSQELIYIASDDEYFRTRVGDKVPNHCVWIEDHSDLSGVEKAFVEFLILSKAERIYGTVGSSFSEEAGLFGGKTVILFEACTIRERIVRRILYWQNLYKGESAASFLKKVARLLKRVIAYV
jgi:hypothetical protein